MCAAEHLGTTSRLRRRDPDVDPGLSAHPEYPSHLVGVGIHNVHPNFQIGLTFARLMSLDRVARIDPLTGQTLTSERPVVHYVQFGMDVVW